jgi:threonine synthase
VNSLNPFRREGQKTVAFEIAEELGGPPDVLALPYGGGGNTRAVCQGFDELGAGLPRILAGEAADRGKTLATAIRIVSPVHRAEAEADVQRSGGAVVSLSDEEIVAAWTDLARLEGVFCEPSSAAGLAAIARERPGGRVVCLVTGHGLKDPDAVERVAPPPIEVDPDPDAIAEAAL